MAGLLIMVIVALAGALAAVRGGAVAGPSVETVTVDRVLLMVPGSGKDPGPPDMGPPGRGRVVPCSPTGPTGGGCWSC